MAALCLKRVHHHQEESFSATRHLLEQWVSERVYPLNEHDPISCSASRMTSLSPTLPPTVQNSSRHQTSIESRARVCYSRMRFLPRLGARQLAQRS